MNKQETIVDIIAEMRALSNSTSDGIIAINGRIVADRLDAAWKRKKSKIVSKNGADFGQLGDAAKLREALKKVAESSAEIMERVRYKDGLAFNTANYIADVAKAALVAPPRNCDMPLVVDGPADNNADKAWLAFKHHNPDAYFDVSGLLRCIDWLFAPAAEQEGGVE